MNVPRTYNCATAPEVLEQHLILVHEVQFYSHWEYLLALSHSDPFETYVPVWRNWEEKLFKISTEWFDLKAKHPGYIECEGKRQSARSKNCSDLLPHAPHDDLYGTLCTGVTDPLDLLDV